MKTILRFVKREPAMVVALIVAGLNAIGLAATDEGTTSLQLLVESLVVLVGGGIVRQNVSPVAK